MKEKERKGKPSNHPDYTIRVSCLRFRSSAWVQVVTGRNLMGL
jgi:hypothetical protein